MNGPDTPPASIRILPHPEAQVRLSPTGDGRLRIDVAPTDPDYYVQGSPLVTHYDPELIELLLDVKGPAYLCDEIARDEDPGYTQVNLEVGILSFLPPEAFAGRRLLDFGCGSAASTMVLSRMLPGVDLTGVELFADNLRVARARAEFYGHERMDFIQSPGGTALPADLGRFDFIVMNAVFEHLLPEERVPIMAALWDRLDPGGVLFLQETPNPCFPVGLHTTGLPLLNYLPDGLAGAAARRFSRRVDREDDWPTLLRAGIRGGTIRELRKLFRRSGAGEPEFLPPTRLGRKDAVDLWYACSIARHGVGGKRKLARSAFKALHRLSGIALVPELSLAIRKHST